MHTFTLFFTTAAFNFQHNFPPLFHPFLPYMKRMKKVMHIKYDDLKMQSYMKSSDVSIQFSKFIFSLRSRMLEISANYPNTASQTFCPVCEDKTTEDSQEHLMLCPELSHQQIVNQLPRYEELFQEDLQKQIQVAASIQANFRLRKKKLVNHPLQKRSQVNQSSVFCSVNSV